MKIKFEVKHKPADSPGSWNDSILRLSINGDYHDVKRIERAIRKAISDITPKWNA